MEDGSLHSMQSHRGIGKNDIEDDRSGGLKTELSHR